jgi:hypothetical protein
MLALDRSEILSGLRRPDLGDFAFLVFLLVLLTTHDGVLMGVRVWGALFVVVGLLLPAVTDRSAYWLVLSATLALELTFSYQSAANHYWLAIYTTLYFLLAAYRREQGRELAFNVPRWLLVVVFGFAGLHKAISTYFASGRLLGGYVLFGDSLYTPLSFLYGEAQDSAIQTFYDVHAEVLSSTKLDGTSLPLVLPDEGLPGILLAISVSVIVCEILVFLALAIPAVFHNRAMPALFLAFVWGTYVFRPEHTFFALLCLLFLLSKPRMPTLWKLLALGSAAVFVALDVGDVGTVL